MNPGYQQEIIRKLAQKYNKSYKEITAIVYSQFKFVRSKMEESTSNKILIAYFGTFSAKPERVKILNERHEKSTKSNRDNGGRHRDSKDEKDLLP